MSSIAKSDNLSPSHPPAAGRREWIGLAVLVLACVVYAMDLTVLHLAVPSISADLQPSGAQLLWIIDIYGFMVAGFLITMGTLGDRIGRRRLLMIGAAGFSLTSLLAAFAQTPDMLIMARALMGISGATLAPSTLSLIFSMFLVPRQRSIAVGIWISGFSAGSAIGPMLGVLLLQNYWWGSVFLLALPVMILLLILGPGHIDVFFVLGQAALWVATLAALVSAVDYTRRFNTAIGNKASVADATPSASTREPVEDLESGIEQRFEDLGARLAASIQERVYRTMEERLERRGAKGEERDPPAVDEMAARFESLGAEIDARVRAALRKKGIPEPPE